jgi:uncharacterized protein YpiB (UPF0302 family)
MYEILYSTGLNKGEKDEKQLTFDEAQQLFIAAQNNKELSFVCSCHIKQNEPFFLYRTIRYFNDKIDAFDGVTAKGICYQKLHGNEYFIQKAEYHDYKYNNQLLHVELNFRNRNFSMPNICMIEVTDNEDKIYYIADINDTFFYRTIEFDDIDILFKDLDTSLKEFLYNFRKTNDNFENEV